MYYLYLLRCADGTLYTGITVDVARRVREHNSTERGAKYTRSRRPVRLVYSKQFRSRSAASKAEHRMKQLSRSEKLKLTVRKLLLPLLALALLGAACQKSTTIVNQPTIPSATNSTAKNDALETIWPSTTARYITAVPVDLSQIERISKYRSCAGHDRSGYDFDRVLETDRSMKHYLFPIPKYQGTLDQVKLFAPFYGTVVSIFLESEKVGGRPHNGNGVVLSTPVDPGVAFGFGHLYFAAEFKVGDRVTAGQLIGYAALGDPGFDFDIDLMGARKVFGQGAETEILGSAFYHMTDAVLAEFAARGITPAAMSWTKEYRDAHPCHYAQPQLMDPGLQGRENADWVALTPP